MSKSIVFGKWDATPKCVFEAKVMSRDDALMTTSPEKFGFKSTFHKLHVRRAPYTLLAKQVHTDSRRFFPMREEAPPLSPRVVSGAGGKEGAPCQVRNS
jgi:hypothetical protein